VVVKRELERGKDGERRGGERAKRKRERDR